MERAEVIKEVSKALETKKIHPAFHPIIKEFFARAVEQYKWTEKDLQKALDSFEYLQGIQFKNMRGLEKARNRIRVNIAKGTIKNNIAIAIEYLKGILTYDIEKIEEFIDVMMHDLGHAIKIGNVVDGKIEIGFQVFNAKNMHRIHGEIIDEFAEIISTKKLQEGNLLNGKYSGYSHMQSAVRATICALGLTEEELFYLQWQGRKKYEEAIMEELGTPLGKAYIIGFEVILDSIHKKYIQGDKIGVIAQTSAFNSLVREVFKERTRRLEGKATIHQLAKLDIEQTLCNEALQDIPRELRIEEKMKLGIRRNIVYGLSKDKMIASMMEEILKEGDRILEERDEMRRREAKFYDNAQLIEEIYEGFSKYPVRLLPISKIPEIIKTKMMNKGARTKRLKDDITVSIQEETYMEKHSRFVKRIIDLAKSGVSLGNNTVRTEALRTQKEHDREE